MNPEIKAYIDTELRKAKSDITRTVEDHNHMGLGSKRINLSDLFGMFETVSTAPSATPQTAYDQIKIYVSGSTYRLYWYDSTAGVWHYVLATA